MSALDNFLNGLGGLGSSLYGTAVGSGIKPNQSNATGDVEGAIAAQQGIPLPTFQPVTAATYNPNQAQASTVGSNAMDGISVNPQYTQAQEAQMAALANLAANGGRNAASDANLAQIEDKVNENNAGLQGAVMQAAAARGQANSGNSLLAQLQGAQSAISNQNAQDTQVAGQEANTALQAGQGAAAIGSNLQNTSFGEQAATAQAQNAIDQFNAQSTQQASEYNANAANQAAQYNTGATNQANQFNNYTEPQAAFSDAAQKANGEATAYSGGTNYFGGQANAETQAQGNLIGSLIGGGAKMASGGGNGGGGQAFGGRIPGAPKVPGDSKMNDTFQSPKLSGGEVVVPRTMTQEDPMTIGTYVKHAPNALLPDQQKAAQMEAIKSIAKRRHQ